MHMMETVVDLVSGLRLRTIAVKVRLDQSKACIHIDSLTPVESSALCFSNKPITYTICFPDLVGCQLSKGATDDVATYVSLYLYPIPVQSNGKDTKMRRRHVHTLRFAKLDANANYNEADSWVQAIRDCLRAPMPCHGPLSGSLPHSRRLLVLVNPHSGPGRALQIFQNSVMPVFAEAGIISKLVVTEYSKHAQYMVQTMDLSLFHGIVIVSGDGLCFEVFNGLFLRDDRDSALKTPVGIIPGGSGNALASAIAYQNKEPFNGLSDFSTASAVIIARPKYQPLKLIHVETPTENYAGFMAASWGLIADVDIESEKFRKTFGTLRFHVGTAARVMFLRSYRGRLSFLPADKADDNLVNNQDKNTISESASDYIIGDNSGVKRCESVGAVNASCSGDGDFPKVHAQFDITNKQRLDNVQQPPQKSTAELRSIWCEGRDPAIPFINEPIPDNWTVLEDDFVIVQLMFLSHIGQDIPFMTRSRMDENIIYLVYIRSADINRFSLLQYMMAIGTEQHLQYPQMKIIACKSVRVEALSGDGVMTLDGELLKGQRMQATVTDFKANIMGKCK